MTPKERAENLVYKMELHQEGYQFDAREQAKECALICVDEIIKELCGDWGDNQWKANENLEYWNEVKEEINKL